MSIPCTFSCSTPALCAQAFSAVERGGSWWGQARTSTFQPNQAARRRTDSIRQAAGAAEAESLCLTNVYGSKLNQSGALLPAQDAAMRQGRGGLVVPLKMTEAAPSISPSTVEAISVCGLSNDVTDQMAEIFFALSNDRGGEAKRPLAPYSTAYAVRMAADAAEIRPNFGGTWQLVGGFIISSHRSGN